MRIELMIMAFKPYPKPGHVIHKSDILQSNSAFVNIIPDV